MGYGEAAVVAFFLFIRVFMVSVNVLSQQVRVLASCTTKPAWARWAIKIAVLYMVSDSDMYRAFKFTGLTHPDSYFFLNQFGDYFIL